MISIFGFHFLVEIVTAVYWSCWSAALIGAGYSLSNTAFALASFFLAQALFEVPTGLAADRFGRRKCTLIGLLVVAVGFSAVALSGSLISLLGAFFVSGVGLTLISGARMSWLLNVASERNSKIASVPKERESFFLNMNLMGRFATILGAFGGVYVLTKSPQALWLGSAGLCLMAIALSLGIETRESRKSHHVDLRFGEIFGALKETVLFLSIVSIFAFGLEAGVRNLINQPYVLKLSGNNAQYLAYFQGSLAAIRIVGILFYKAIRSKVEHMGHYFSLVFPLVIFSVAQLIAASTESFWMFMVVYGAAVFCLGWYFPLRDEFINSIVSEKLRATLLSFDSMLMNLGSALALVFVSFRLNESNISSFWLVGAAALIVSAVCLSAAIKAKDQRKLSN